MEQDQKLNSADVIRQLRKSKKLHTEITQQFENQYAVCGKLMTEWREHFSVHLPPDPDTSMLKALDAELMELIQDASFYKSTCQAKLDAQKGANKAYFRARYAELVSKYEEQGKKLPSKDTLTNLAEKYIGELYDATIHMEIEVNFWKDVISNLYECRKLIENATWNLSVEQKALNNDKYLDAMNRKGF